MEFATFGAGCFWGVEEKFRSTPGVIATAVGYMGGDITDPTYHDVCTGRTGHAEVVHMEFDPAIVSYQQLLEVFWQSHNPTTLNRQGPDIGTQYRSVIFYHSEEQKQTAEQLMKEMEEKHLHAHPLVTQIVPAQPFYRAEEYHQQYLAKRGLNNCHI